MSRRAVANLVGYDDEILDSAGAIRLLRRFSIKAVGLMTVLAKHVAQYRCAAWDAADLIHRLSPLILDRSATGPRLTQEPGRCRAFLHLLACGFFDAKGLRLGTTLRGLLEELACSGGPLVHGSRPTVYLVSA